MKSYLIACSTLVLTALTSAAGAQERLRIPDGLPDASQGDGITFAEPCYRDGNYLGNLYYLPRFSNEQLILNLDWTASSSKDTVYVALDGNTIKFSSNERVFKKIDLSEILSQDADKKILQFGILNGVVVLYWKIITKERRYSYGIYSLSIDGISCICQGYALHDPIHF